MTAVLDPDGASGKRAIPTSYRTRGGPGKLGDDAVAVARCAGRLCNRLRFVRAGVPALLACRRSRGSRFSHIGCSSAAKPRVSPAR